MPSLSTWLAGAGLVALGACILAEIVPSFEETSDRDDESSPDFHFSRSYVAARAKFRARATAAGAKVESIVIARDEELGIDLTTDVAFFQGSKPDSLIVHMSGTHGVEGFAGSAIQSSLLSTLENGRSGGPSLLFIHAVNPYGFHFNRRFNENNVDINRNFLLTEAERQAARERPANKYFYEDLNGLLNPSGVQHWWQYFTVFPLRVLFHLHFIGVAKTALVAGQYHNSRGVYYGGRDEERSTAMLRDVIGRYAKRDGIRKVVAIDVHSGLGPCSVDTLMLDNDEERDTARALIPAEAARMTAPSDGGASGGYDATMGTVSVRRLAPADATSVHITQEFGTRPGIFVLWGLVFENAAYHTTHANSRTREFAGKKLRDAFFVDTLEWKRSVLDRGVTLARHAIKSLS